MNTPNMHKKTGVTSIYILKLTKPTQIPLNCYDGKGSQAWRSKEAKGDMTIVRYVDGFSEGYRDDLTRKSLKTNALQV